jgi:hypothetical protein
MTNSIRSIQVVFNLANLASTTLLLDRFSV